MRLRPTRLLHPVDLHLPSLPPRLKGRRIAHITDLHVRRPAPLHQHLIDQLATQSFDLLIFTGDLPNHAGNEPATLDLLHRLLQKVQPGLGAYGVFGNHDTAAFRQQARQLPIHWLANTTHAQPEHNLEIWGLDTHETSDDGADAIALITHRRNASNRLQPPTTTTTAAPPPFRLLLAHSPVHLPMAADLGVDLLLAGHTHGGQCRLPTGHALINACDMPLHLAAGILRHRRTLAAVSRGLGYSGRIPRLFCPPQVPIYTLHHTPAPHPDHPNIQNLQPW